MNIFKSLFLIFGFTLVVCGFTFAENEPTVSVFKVSGSCGMCEKAIEASVRVKGVKKVAWDKSTLELTVVYNAEIISLDEIHRRIAAIGYDTDKVKADDKVYAKLDDCCKYERKL